jgi:hypothetical protein
MIFQSLMGLGKLKCDVPNGATQGCFRPQWVLDLCKYICGWLLD